MADSQLACLEDGLMPAAVPETRPQFYYSERQRVALERLLSDGDGAFKSFLKEEKSQDFLSAREIKTITAGFVKYRTEEETERPGERAAGAGEKGAAARVERAAGAGERGAGAHGDGGSLRSTYWPQLSDTEVPPLDIGWPSSGLFKGVTRVSVFTHPPKENSPHIKEVVRKLIQEASKVLAIVMDLLTDLEILRDLFEASKRGVPVYIVLDVQGVPHFLDMCSRLQVGARELQNVRTRTVKGVGLSLSSGRIPGNVHSKYMLVDGEKVMFGTYSFSWSSSRMDRNMITLMSGQILDFYDLDFRELYASSDKLDLFREFQLGRPQTGTLSRASLPRRPTTATSRFQVNLGDVKVPEHKYHNPKYLLALGQIPGQAPLQNFLDTLEPPNPDQIGPENPTLEPEEPTPDPDHSGKKEKHKTQSKNKRSWWKRRKRTSDADEEKNLADGNVIDPGEKKRTLRSLFKRST